MKIAAMDRLCPIAFAPAIRPPGTEAAAVRYVVMRPYSDFARQLESSIRWSNLVLAQSRLSLLTMRLMLREGRNFQRGVRQSKRSITRKRKR